MKFKFTIICIFGIILYSCKGRNNKQWPDGDILPEIIIKEEPASPDKNIDNLISEDYFIRLETKRESLVKEISKIIIHNDKIIVADYKMNRILIFREDGAFINNISHPGKGPEEYIYMADVYFDEIKKEINIFDLGSRSIKKYDLDGNYRSSTEIIFQNAGRQFYLNDSIYVFYRENDIFPANPDFSISVLDIEQKIIGSGGYIPIQLRDIGIKSFNSIDIHDNIVYINPLGNDTIFQISNGGTIKPVYCFRFPKIMDYKKTKEWKKTESFSPDLITDVYSKKMIININKLFVTERYIVFEVIYKGRQIGIFNKNSSKTITIQNPEITSEGILLNIIGKYDEYLIAEIGSHEKYEKLNKVVKENYITLSDNPVLYFFKLKPKL